MGSPLKIVEIPVRVRRLEPLILDENMRCFQPQGAIEDDGGGFQLSRYPEIGRLVIPESLDIPHDEWFSPFATYHGRGFCIDRHTRWEKVKIYEIENRSPHLTVKDGVLYSADMRRLIYCFEEMDTFTVPPQVATIEPFAFCGQTRLKQITLHEGITDMGPAAFMGCSRLQEVIIPPVVKLIPDDCFDGCESLCQVVLPDGLQRIGNCAFRTCRELTEIHLPATVTGLCSFDGCSSLREIEIPAGVERVEGFMFCHSLQRVILHAGVRSIADYAFRNCYKLRHINFPEGLEYIGSRAFYPSSLRQLDFPSTLQEIGCEAFYYNWRLWRVKFQNTPREIGLAAFACCLRLLKPLISMPKGMTMAKDVFRQDSGLDKFGFWD